MTFRNIILYNLVKYLITGDDLCMKKFVSLCQAFDIDRAKMLNRFYSTKTIKLIGRALRCDTFLDEIELSYPGNVLKELLTLKLDRYSKVIKKSFKLPNTGSGIVIINGNTVRHRADDETLGYVKLKYSPSVYKYVETDATDNVHKGSTILFFGHDNTNYFTYVSSKKIISNTDIGVKVTDDCIRKLLDAGNSDLLDSVFTSKSNALSNALNEIYLSVKDVREAASSSLYGDDLISDSN